jgi:NADH:ubiquinone oxidoreductase subunit C
MKEEVNPISLDTLVGEAGRMKAEGYRLVTMSAAELDAEKVDILYHFDKNLTMKHLRLTVAKDVQVPSISSVYLAALLVENEIQDLFGVRFKGLAIDFNRTLYLDEEIKTTPLCRYTVSRVNKGEPAAKGAAEGS